MFTRVLWIVDQPGEIVDDARFLFTIAASALEALKRLQFEEFDAILASFPLPDCASEAALLEELQRVQPSTPVVIQSPDTSVADVVKLIMLAAKSKNLPEAPPGGFSEELEEPWRRLLVGESRAMQKVVEAIRLVAPRRSTILITGETGTGKEVVARAIHAAGNRSHLPMVCVNCTAFPETLLEAELFGHVKGAFTGAAHTRIGRFEQAHRGTIFLDEIGDMPLSLQAKLLRVLQEREFQRLGSSENIRVDVRVIAATNAGLIEKIKEGKFREDLYYRLNVVPVVLPPMRDRSCDVPVLVQHFLEKICVQEALSTKQISHEALRRLASHDWPGNVRELENAVEQAVVLSGDRMLLFPGDFPLPARTYPIKITDAARSFIALPDHGLDFEHTVGAIERNILEQALRKTGGNKKMAAEMLGLKRTTLSAKLKTFSAVAAAG